MDDFFKKKQLVVAKDWEQHWKDMPEFICNDLTPKYQIIMSFRDDKARKEFSKLINQPITNSTKSLWYPKEEIDVVKDLRYVNE